MRSMATVVAGVAAIAVLGAGGALVYHSGFMAGMEQSGAVAAALAVGGAGATGASPYAPWAYGLHPWGHGPGPFGFFGMLLVLFLVFGLLRAAFWGGPWGHRGGPHNGHGHGPWDGHLRNMHDEWRRGTGQQAPTGPAGEATSSPS